METGKLGWTFLAGVADTANQAFEAAIQVVDLFKEDRERITMESGRAGSTLRINAFPAGSFSHSKPDCSGDGFFRANGQRRTRRPKAMGIVDEVTGRKRGRVFSYQRYLSILGEGTDPLPLNS